jgi:hypothetical protein
MCQTLEYSYNFLDVTGCARRVGGKWNEKNGCYLSLKKGRPGSFYFYLVSEWMEVCGWVVGFRMGGRRGGWWVWVREGWVKSNLCGRAGDLVLINHPALPYFQEEGKAGRGSFSWMKAEGIGSFSPWDFLQVSGLINISPLSSEYSIPFHS